MLDTAVDQVHNEEELKAAADDHVRHNPPSSKRLHV